MATITHRLEGETPSSPHTRDPVCGMMGRDLSRRFG